MAPTHARTERHLVDDPPQHRQWHTAGPAHPDELRPRAVAPVRAAVPPLRDEDAEEFVPFGPHPLPQALGFDREIPLIGLGVAPHVQHAHLAPVALGHLDPSRDRDSLSGLQLVNRPWHGLPVGTLDEDRVIAGHANGASVARSHLVAVRLGGMGDQMRGGRGELPSALAECRHRVAVERVFECRLQGRHAGAAGDGHTGGHVSRGKCVRQQPRCRLLGGFPSKFRSVVVEHLLVGEDRVEDPDDRRIHPLLAVVGHRQRLRVALGLVVHAARADRVDVAPVALRLGVFQRVSVYLAGRRDQEARTLGLGQPERVVRAVGAHLQRVQRQAQVVDRRGRRGEVVDEVDWLLHVVGLDDVNPHMDEAIGIADVLDVRERARLQVVDADHTVAAREQGVAQVRSEEAGAAGD